MDDELRRAATIAGCCDTIARAARLADLQQHEAFAALFTEEAELQRPGGAWLRGREAILAAYRERPAERLTRHLIAGTVVDLLADGDAAALSTVLLWSGVRTDPDGPSGRPARGPRCVGEFDDRLRRGDDGVWRIVRRQARFVLHEGEGA